MRLPELISEGFVLLKHDPNLSEDAQAKTTKNQIKGLICFKENRKSNSNGNEVKV